MYEAKRYYDYFCNNKTTTNKFTDLGLTNEHVAKAYFHQYTAVYFRTSDSLSIYKILIISTWIKQD